MLSGEEDLLKGLDYATFLKIIQNIPSCIFFKDTKLRYRFCTHFWEQLMTNDIIGKTDLEIRKDKENAIMAMELDRNIIRSKKGCNYVIKSDIDGHVSYLELIKEPVLGDDGEVIGIVGLINDVTEKTIMEERLKELTTTDSLTKLRNRSSGTEVITSLLGDKKGNKVFCLLDINGFKRINDTFGHQIGDSVLREFGYALRRSIYDSDVAMRLGGDEFIVLLCGIKEQEQVKSFVAKLQENIDKIDIDGFDGNVSVSIGARKVGKETNFDDLYSETDKLMYEAKQHKEDHLIICGFNK